MSRNKTLVGGAEPASDHGSDSCGPIKSLRSSGRNRKRTLRFEAGPAKRAPTKRTKRTKPGANMSAKPAKSPSYTSSSSSSEDEEEEESEESEESEEDEESEESEESEPESWVMRLPTFAEKYPALHAQTTGAITASLGAEIYALVKDHVRCIDAHSNIWTRASSIAKDYLDMISQMRVANDLQPIPNVQNIIEQVKTQWYGSYIASSMCPDDHPLLSVYIDVASAMEISATSSSQSCEKILQECYDTTKTEAFKRAVEQVVTDSKPLLYAIRMWQEHKGSDNVKNFLIKYARALYNRTTKQMKINIRF